MCCDETVEYSARDGWPNGDVGGSRRGTLELGTEDTNEQSLQACTEPRLARENMKPVQGGPTK